MRVLHIVNDAETGGAQTLIEQLLLSREAGDEAHLLVLLSPGHCPPPRGRGHEHHLRGDEPP